MFKILGESMFNGILPEAVFSSLLHSLWLGVLLAAFAGLVIIFTRKSGPHIRYQLLTFLLAAFFFSEIFLFYKTISASSIIAHNSELQIQGATTQSLITISEKQQPATVLSSVKAFITEHSSWFVVCWLIVICFRSLQLILGFREMGRLKNQQLIDVGDFWNDKMERLIVSIGLSKPVAMYKSAVAAAPMVIGFFKPVILFPAAVFNSLSTEEIEAIILHELAHIRRNDFAVNMGQRFLEIIFFFNPGVLWVSDLIRREREYCCDDLAVSVIQNKKLYVNALVAFQEFQLVSGMNLATAFPGTKNQILQRINRIIGNNNKSLNTMEKFILASAIVITAAATVAFSQNKKHEGVSDSSVKTQSTNIKKDGASANEVLITETPVHLDNALTDTTPDNINIKHSLISEYNLTYKGKKYEIVKKEDKILSMKIDGREIPAGEMGRYRSETDSIDAMIKRKSVELEKEVQELSESKAMHLLQEHAFMDEKLALHNSLNKDLFEKELLLNEHLSELQPKLLLDMNEINAEALAKANLEFKLSEKQRELAMTQLLGKIHPDSLSQKINTETAEALELELMHMDLQNKLQNQREYSLQHQQLLSKSLEMDALFNKLNQESLLNQANAFKLQELAVKNQEDLSEVIDILFEKGVIKDRQNFKMKLTNSELLINGKKQPADLHQEILKRYQKKPGDKVNFEYNITH